MGKGRRSIQRKCEKAKSGQVQHLLTRRKSTHTVGKYATENGATKAAVHCSKVLNIEINELTARKFKNEYQRELTVCYVYVYVYVCYVGVRTIHKY